MNWQIIIKLLLPIIIEWLGTLGTVDECPDGVCEPIRADLQSLQADLDQPSANSIGDFLKCVDFARLIAAVRELIAVIREGLNGCPPEAVEPIAEAPENGATSGE